MSKIFEDKIIQIMPLVCAGRQVISSDMQLIFISLAKKNRHFSILASKK